jgi:predicted phage terminase large subunit-like protein
MKGGSGVIGSCDVADEGDDDFSAPFGIVAANMIYITHVLFTKDGVEITQPRLSQMIIDSGCDLMRIESNNGGRIFALGVREIIKEKRGKCEIQARPTTKNKETRILMKSGWIKNHCKFLDESEYPIGSDYARFMKGLTTYKKEGGNKHDDAPDSMTILAELYESFLLQAAPRRVARGAGR